MLGDKPLVSIFMLTYNHESYIENSIESVLNQEYENLEIVICDDFSTDNTARKVQEYADKYPKKIKAIFNQENLGITRSSNLVLGRCSGKYVALHSGDDLFLPGKIQKQVTAMEENDQNVLCYHDVEVFHSSSDERIRYWNQGVSSNEPYAGSVRNVVKEVVAKDTSFMAATTVMVRRTAIPETGFDERIKVASDWYMWIEILALSGGNGEVVFLPGVLSRYRRHSSNVSNSMQHIYEDMLLTLSLTESNYPWLISEIEISREKIRYRKGVQLIRAGERNLGRKYLKLCMRKRGISRQWLRWYLGSYFPVLLRSKKEIFWLLKR